MYHKMPAILKRTAWAKSLGFGLSLIAFITIAITWNYQEHQMISWGILLWYPMVGAMIWLAGVMDKHPLLWKMGIWRGIMIWAFMNFLFVLLAADSVLPLLSNFWLDFTLVVLFWAAVLEWAIIWWAIDWFVTARFGEWKKLMKK